MTKLVSIFILLAAAFTLAASAPGIESSGEQIVTTRHQIKVGQKILRYTARAGLLPIRRNETGEIHGHMFFVAYLLDARPSLYIYQKALEKGLGALVEFGGHRQISL